jgi:glycosyltransferase involved in cell wall biosynthesis
MAISMENTESNNKENPLAGVARPLRLAIVLSHPVQYFSPLFRRLAQQPEIDPTVLYSSLAGSTPAMDPGFGVTVAWDTPLLQGYRYKVLKNLWRGGPKGAWTYTSPGVVRELWRAQYDALMVYGWGDFTARLAILAARLAGIPCLVTADSNFIYEQDLPWLKARLKKAVLGWLFRHIQAFLVTGPFNRKFYNYYGVGDDRFFFAPLPIDTEYFRRRAELAHPHQGEIRARYGIPPDLVLLLFMGKLIPRKRPLDIVAVLQSLQPAFPNLGAVWVGDGELRPQLEAEIAAQGVRNTFVLGFKNQAELPELYAMSDIFVLPSSYDPMPLVTNEAMACGLPAIVSNRTGVWGPGAMVREGETGFVHPAGDTEVLSQAVRKLLLDPELRRAMGRRATEIVEQFGIESCVRGIREALRFVVQRRSGKAVGSRQETIA